MPRDFKVYLEDIQAAIAKVRRYTEGVTKADLKADDLRLDAVIRNLEVIGEAVKALPESVRARRPDIEWRKIAGLRDVLIHGYFGIELDIVWDVVANKLDDLDAAASHLLEE